MDRVRVIGVGMTRQGRLDADPRQLAVEAARAAMADAGVPADQVSTVIVSNALGGNLVDQACIRGQAWLRGIGATTAPVLNVDNGCAGGASALHLGYLTVLAQRSPVLVVGVEKMWTGDRAATLDGIEQCLVADERPGLQARAAVESSGSVFMGLNATWANRQLDERATTREHFAASAAKAYRNASMNPLAQQHGKVVSADEVLAAATVAGPLTRLMCSSFTDGAAAVLLAGDRDLTAPIMRASILRSGDGTLEYHDRLDRTAALAWKAADIGPADIDVAEVHDATAAEELYALESLGFYECGEAGPATVRGETDIDGGGVAVNTSGGLVARGHPIGATGICQVVELTLQLRGDAGARQVRGARTAMSVNTGGILNGDIGACGVHVLSN